MNNMLHLMMFKVQEAYEKVYNIITQKGTKNSN